MSRHGSQQLSDFRGFASRLVRKARVLARAHGETAIRKRRADASRWRRPSLLWPLFNREDR